jgi:hypothetical protein
VLWVWINDNRYAFSYNHNEQCIDIRRESVRGSILNRFDNNTTIEDLLNFFNGLYPPYNSGFRYKAIGLYFSLPSPLCGGRLGWGE